MAYIAGYPALTVSRFAFEGAAIGVQSSIGVPGGYTPGMVDVFVGGAALSGIINGVATDFDDSDGASIKLTLPMSPGTQYRVVCYAPASFVPSQQNSLLKTNNLSDVANKATSCTNIGALQASNNLSDVASAATARTNLGVVAKAGDTMTGLLILSGDPAAALGAVTKQYADGKVSKSGDTITGPLVVTGGLTTNGSLGISSGASNAVFYTIANAGTYRFHYFQTAGSNRWDIGANSGAESGGNAGSDFVIDRYADNGSWLTTPFVIYRSSGLVQISNGLTVNSSELSLYSTNAYSPGIHFNANGYNPFIRAYNNGPGFIQFVNSANTYVNFSVDDSGNGQFRNSVSAGYALFNNAANQTKIAVLNYAGSQGYGMTFQPANDNTPTVMLFMNAGGGGVGAITTNATNTAYNTASDYRLKENVTDLTGGLARILQCRPVAFNWKATGELGHGFIAHELQAVEPGAVSGEKDATRTDPADPDGAPVPSYQGVDASKLVPDLVAAIKELVGTVNELTSRIVVLEGARS